MEDGQDSKCRNVDCHVTEERDTKAQPRELLRASCSLEPIRPSMDSFLCLLWRVAYSSSKVKPSKKADDLSMAPAGSCSRAGRVPFHIDAIGVSTWLVQSCKP